MFPLICPMCGGQMRIIAFITFSADITPARGPPLWEGECALETGEGVEAEPDWGMANQSPPDYPDDQRTAW